MRKLLFVSLALNAVVLVLIAWVAMGPGQRTIVRAFLEGHHARQISAFEALPIAPDDVVFLGDSITEAGPWEELFPGIRVRNRGIGGDTTGGVLRRLEQVTSGGPAKVFLLIGTNDLGRGASEAEIVAGWLYFDGDVADLAQTFECSEAKVRAALALFERFLK